jgi:hypothetical protein
MAINRSLPNCYLPKSDFLMIAVVSLIIFTSLSGCDSVPPPQSKAAVTTVLAEQFPVDSSLIQTTIPDHASYLAMLDTADFDIITSKTQRILSNSRPLSSSW